MKTKYTVSIRIDRKIEIMADSPTEAEAARRRIYNANRLALSEGDSLDVTISSNQEQTS